MIENHLKLLGYKVRDRVTTLEGVVSSITFDLFGCIQAVINPGLDDDGKPRDCIYMDLTRLEVISKNPVMAQPDFSSVPFLALGQKGPSEKPAPKH